MRNRGFSSLLMAVLLFLLTACSPSMVESIADAERCYDPSPETLDEVFGSMVESGIPLEQLTAFLLSDAYSANPNGWDWAFCLMYYGWECEGMTGIGTPAPTPPTSCASPRGTGGVAQRVMDNPYTD